ncbi:MAG TPA: hypothetical protein DEF18_09755 [Muricauda sp.]|uniref:Gliding motility-associated C-terminal domain-containing protein n=1 Tax=Flagellimonas aurea TaxID=2915619 RepID=A0ABS3G6L9_9FLAO|nr:gliding motility-associated C-terminal domain-containing protein [Allomuricauda aurea]MBO0355065.1 gliding motility-associated C-terminal domain-containing protein [Allomuricauda aurea]HBU78375.1 hypothetical protein [Allomuricauda sp.]
MQARLKTTSSTPCAAMGRGRILIILFLLLGIGVGFGQTVSITASEPNASEAGLTSGEFTISVTGGTALTTVEVFFEVDASSTATPGVDYTTLSPPVSVFIPLLGGGNGSETLDVDVLQDPLVEFDETVIVNLLEDDDYDLAPNPANRTATVTIISEDLPDGTCTNLAAPNLDTTEPTVFCEAIFVDLDNYVNNVNGPGGTQLVWSRNPSPDNVDDQIDSNIEDGSGVYYGFYYDNANDCYGASLELELERNFTPTIIETTAEQICGSGTSVLTVTAEVEDLSAITYSWFDSLDTNASPIATGTTFETGELTETTSFYVSAASNECASEREEVVVTVNNEPLAGAPVDGLQACNVSSDEGPNAFDLDDGLIGQDPGTWTVITDPSEGNVTIGAENVVDFTGLPSGDYIFEYTTNTVGNCTETASAQITITVQDCISNEAIDLAITKTVEGRDAYLLGEEIVFVINVENVDENLVMDIVVTDMLDENFEFLNAEATLGNYDSGTGEWTIPEMTPADLNATLTITVRARGVGDIPNTAALVSSVPVDGNPENNTGTISVNVNRSQCVYPGTICNIFSPNGDGYNDTLTLVGDHLFPNNTFEVFDRYGNSVFQMDGYDSSWDGTGKNGDLPKGTYFYVLDLNGDGTDVLKGWIQIVRDN